MKPTMIMRPCFLSCVVLLLFVLGKHPTQGNGSTGTRTLVRQRTRRVLQDDSNNKCQTLSNNGNFGVLTGSTTLLEFTYEVEYDRFEIRIGDILQELQVAMVAQLLPAVFGDDCNGLNRDGDMASYLGLSAAPEDQPVTSNKYCSSKTLPEHFCQAMRGRIMLYHKTQPVASSLETLQNVLQSAMNEKELLNGVGGAVRVTYVGGDPNTSSSATDGINSPTGTNATVCQATSAGTFGDMSSPIGVTVHYGYEMELVLPLSTPVKDILPKVEKALLNRLLPRLFPSQCRENDSTNSDKSNGISNRMRRLQLSSITELKGISLEPSDTVASAFSCQPRFDASNVCQAIHGRMTIWPGTNVGAVLSQIRQTISNDNAKLRQADPAILDLRFFTMDDSARGDSGTDTISDVADSDKFDSTYIIIGAIVLVLLCLCCCGLCFLQDRLCCMFQNPGDQQTKTMYDTATDDDLTAPALPLPQTPSPRRNSTTFQHQSPRRSSTSFQHESFRRNSTSFQQQQQQQPQAPSSEEPLSPRSPRKPPVMGHETLSQPSPPQSPRRSGYPNPPLSPTSRGGYYPTPHTAHSVPTQRQYYHQQYHHPLSPSRSVPTNSRHPMGTQARSLPPAPTLAGAAAGENSHSSLNYNHPGRRGSASSQTAMHYSYPGRRGSASSQTAMHYNHPGRRGSASSQTAMYYNHPGRRGSASSQTAMNYNHSGRRGSASSQTAMYYNHPGRRGSASSQTAMNYNHPGRRGSASSQTASGGSVASSTRKTSMTGSTGSQHSRQGSNGGDHQAPPVSPRKAVMGHYSQTTNPRRGSVGEQVPARKDCMGQESSSSTPRGISIENHCNQIPPPPPHPRRGSTGSQSCSPKKGSADSTSPSLQSDFIGNQSIDNTQSTDSSVVSSPHKASSQKKSKKHKKSSTKSSSKSPTKRKKSKKHKKKDRSDEQETSDVVVGDAAAPPTLNAANEPSDVDLQTPASGGKPLTTLPETPMLEID